MQLHRLSARDLAARIKSGDVSSEDATQHYINRIEAHNGAVNAVVADRFDAAG